MLLIDNCEAIGNEIHDLNYDYVDRMAIISEAAIGDFDFIRQFVAGSMTIVDSTNEDEWEWQRI